MKKVFAIPLAALVMTLSFSFLAQADEEVPVESGIYGLSEHLTLVNDAPAEDIGSYNNYVPVAANNVTIETDYTAQNDGNYVVMVLDQKDVTGTQAQDIYYIEQEQLGADEHHTFTLKPRALKTGDYYVYLTSDQVDGPQLLGQFGYFGAGTNVEYDAVICLPEGFSINGEAAANVQSVVLDSDGAFVIEGKMAVAVGISVDDGMSYMPVPAKKISDDTYRFVPNIDDENAKIGIILRGDVNMDKDISLLDAVDIQKIKLGVDAKALGYLAADTNHDNSVSLLDAVQIQKDRLGTATIEWV
ncbi:MAG: hypothetical protein IJ617_03995 [Oscillospiraceae bacterium]|nr:hypothetical protein [Oscillospiraceae bacterium]